jgi:putative membrane protein
MTLDQLPKAILLTLAFGAVGIALFALAFWLITLVTPFSIKKEIEEDQNTALAVLIGSVIIGVAIIVAAVVHG